MHAPVVLFVYNRLAHVKLTLESLSNNTISNNTDLYIYSDGPKSLRDAAIVESIRAYIRNVSGFLSVTCIERPTNFGLARSVISGATEVLEKHGKIIVLEDDLVSSKNFLAYMNAALDHYRDDPRAFSVTGHTFPEPYLKIPHDYPYDTYAGYRCSSWSWGTWSDRWKRIDWDMSYYLAFSKDPASREAFNRGGQDMSELLRLQYEGKIDSWAIRFCYAHYSNAMRCIYPKKTLVMNVGLDNSGTHCRPEPRFTHASLNDDWIPSHFCPSSIIDDRIMQSFRSVFDDTKPCQGISNLFCKAKGLIRRTIRLAHSAARKLFRLVVPSKHPVGILVLNTFQKQGGAARAAWRTFLGLRNSCNDVSYLTLLREDTAQEIIGHDQASLSGQATSLFMRFDRLALKFYRNRSQVIFSPAVFPNPFRTPLSRFRPRLVHLHWVAFGLLRIEELARLRVPVVWTLHDTWAFTGGCHYTGECDGFLSKCGNCPQLASGKDDDLSRKVWQRKRDTYANMDLTVVAPSRWLANLAKKSSLIAGRRIEIIPNGLDTNVFRPLEKSVAKTFLGLDPLRPVLLFGAQWLTDRRKGGDLLASALQELDSPFTLLTFGEGQMSFNVNPKITIHSLGRLHDDISLAATYSAADVFICPSREDNLPNTVAEAMACGTPCVAFDANGLPDMISHRVNGYLAKAFEPTDLAAGIHWLATHSHPGDLRQAAREKALAEYSLEVMSARYKALYAELLGK